MFYLYLYIYTHFYIYLSKSICLCIYIYTYACIYVCLYVYEYAYAYSLCICIICICICRCKCVNNMHMFLWSEQAQLWTSMLSVVQIHLRMLSILFIFSGCYWYKLVGTQIYYIPSGYGKRFAMENHHSE